MVDVLDESLQPASGSPGWGKEQRAGAAAGALVTIDGTLVVQLNPALTDGAVRELRDAVSRTLAERTMRGVVVNLAAVDVMDSYITRCIRDLAVSARLMGVPTVVCGVQPAVADTLVEMDLGFGEVRTALNIDRALRVIRMARRAED
jgi:rsbT antagonist protein RsbS